MLSIPGVKHSSGLSGNARAHKKGYVNEYEVDTQAGSSTRSVTSSCELESRSFDGDAGRDSPSSEGNEGAAAGRELLQLLKKPESGATTRTRLKSSASLFTPGQAKSPPAPPPPVNPRENAKVPIRCVIEGAFGNRLYGMHVADMPTHTELEILVSAKPTEMFGPMAIDPQACSRALHMLLQSFKVLPQIKALEPSPDQSKLTIKYTEASTDRLCWEFGQYGYCPRGHSCRWEHVVMEVFIISIVMQPLAMDMSPFAPATSQVSVCSFGDFPSVDLSAPCPMMGYVMPMPSNMEPVPGMAYAVPMPMGPMGACTAIPMQCSGEVAFGVVDGEAQTKAAAGSSGSRSTSPMGSPKARSNRVAWADIEDDEAGELDSAAP